MRLRLDCQLRRGDFDLQLRDSLDLQAIAGIFGPSGCGKTTLLRLVAGLERGGRGRIVFEDECWQDSERGLFVPPHRRRVGIVFQDARLFEHLDVAGNLHFARRRNRGPITWDEVLEALDLRPLLQRAVPGLSGGERQRVAIGRALLAQPRLLLLDEPLSALDQRRKEEILPYLKRLPQAFRVPLIYVTHDLEEIANLSPELLLMNEGRLRGRAKVAELLAARRPPWPERRLSQSLEAVVLAHDAAGPATLLELGGQRLRLDTLAGTPGAALRIQVDAADVLVFQQPPPASSAQGSLRAVLRAISDEEGSALSVLHLEAGGQPLLAQISRAARKELELREGQEVHLLLQRVVPSPAQPPVTS